MPDPIERMNRMRGDVEGGAMLPAAEVRRRGDRLRRRRTAAITAGTAAAVAAVVVPVAVLAGGGAPPEDRVAPATSPTQSATAATLSEANLLTDEETFFTDEVRWTRGDTYAGEGQAALHACESEALTGHGAAVVFRRDWTVEGTSYLGQAVGEWETETAARGAYAALVDEIRACDRPLIHGWLPDDISKVEFPDSAEATTIHGSYRIDGDAGGEAFNDHDLTVGLAVARNRVTVLAYDRPTGSSPPQGDPVDPMLPTAVSRLIGETAATPITPATDSPTPSGDPLEALTSDPTDDRDPPAPGSSATAIPDGFPLADGLEAGTPEPGLPGIEGPSRSLPPVEDRACGAVRDPGASTDRLNARYTDIELVHGLQLTLYEDADAAWAEVADFLAFYDACPAEEVDSPENYGLIHSVKRLPGYGEEAWAAITLNTFDGNPGIYLDVTVVVRTGNAILTITMGNEGGMHGYELMDRIDDWVSTAAVPIEAMCQFSANGC